ncbi:hypothetical protein BGI32_03980 [Snodgrassella alvi]|uniref:Uncharacterized protein n=1 Tax=Snodgrassella alvi TaxID=1196083 RepID=A0A2N9WUS3_9NEIS|nr:STY0301 family protein [Snodgrassella alvi]PIT16586.1 hypothetical protein BGI32_03980 [Snodgrassella alvi]
MNNGMDSSCRIVRLNSEVMVKLLMTENNIMLLNNRKIAILFTSLLLSIVSINSYGQTPVVSCPATFSDEHGTYRLINVRLFDGPICMKVTLVPEFKKDKQLWVLDTLMDPSLVCKYAGTNHYIVLDAKGATYCEKKGVPVQANCMQ